MPLNQKDFPGPRMVRVSRGLFKAHILAESHYGISRENDPYFQSVVLPVVRRAQALIHEAADLRGLPGSPYWGKTCLDSNPAAVSLSQQVVERIVRHHRYSQWADLHRAFSEDSKSTTVEQFEVFIRGRGLMLNLLDLSFHVYDGLYRQELRKVPPRRGSLLNSGSAGSGSRVQISRLIPQLPRESIESLEDFGEVICALEPAEQELVVRDALMSVDRLPQTIRNRPRNLNDLQAEVAFGVMRLQMGFGTTRARKTLDPYISPNNKLRSGVAATEQLDLSGGAAVDRMLLALRNMKWANRVEQHAELGRRDLFYVFGAAHLIDYDQFDGLLTLLKQRGFQIDLVL